MQKQVPHKDSQDTGYKRGKYVVREADYFFSLSLVALATVDCGFNDSPQADLTLDYFFSMICPLHQHLRKGMFWYRAQIFIEMSATTSLFCKTRNWCQSYFNLITAHVWFLHTAERCWFITEHFNWQIFQQIFPPVSSTCILFHPINMWTVLFMKSINCDIASTI